MPQRGAGGRFIRQTRALTTRGALTTRRALAKGRALVRRGPGGVSKQVLALLQGVREGAGKGAKEGGRRVWKVFSTVLEKQGRAPRSVIGGVPAIRQGGAIVGAGAGGAGKEGIMSLLGKSPGKLTIAMILADLLAQKAISTHYRKKELGMEAEMVERQAEMMTPEAMYYQAMMPKVEERSAQTYEALVEEMGGRPQLAEGEELIGGV